LSDKAPDKANKSAVEVRLVVGNAVQEEDLRKLLNTVFIVRNVRSGLRKTPSKIVIYAYASEDAYRDDPTWWVGRLYWTHGKEPLIELKMDALIPRQETFEYAGLSREEYLDQVDVIASEVKSAMSSMEKVFRDYEKMNVDEGVFKKKGREYAGILVRNVRETEPPVPPFNDCADLDTAFKNMLNGTRYFQDIFSENPDAADKPRFDTEEFYNNLTEFNRLSGVYNSERDKYNKKESGRK
jgi:hypothetical protein